MVREILAVNTRRNMPKTSVSTTARNVCHWSDIELHSVLVWQE